MAAVVTTVREDRVGRRNEAFDFVKGSLVFVMVLYHWLNYFVGLDWFGYRYIRFLTPSFIFITGFLVSHVYLARYEYDSSRLRSRLIQRGLRLLVLFCVLNLIVDLATRGGATTLTAVMMSWLSRARGIFVTGDGRAAFGILVPIGYFLVLVPVVLTLSKRMRVSLMSIAAVGLSLTIGASLLNIGNSHLEMLSIALIGLASGTIDMSRIDAIIRRPVPLVMGYILYVAAITIFDVLFALQVIGVCLSVMLLYAIAIRCGWAGALYRSVADLGKYSLFSYIAQIAALQLLRRALRAYELAGGELMVPFVIAVVATLGAVHAMAAVRNRSVLADSLYRAVFA